MDLAMVAANITSRSHHRHYRLDYRYKAQKA